MDVKNSTKLIFMGTLPILAIGIVLYSLKGEVKTKETAPNAGEIYVAGQKNVPMAIDTTNNTQPAQQQLRKTSAMAREFYTSQDLRAFVEQAKKRPQEGGMTYAYKAIVYCRDAQKMPSSMPYRSGENSVSYSKRLSTFNQMKYRCQGFSEEELSDEALGTLNKDRKKKQDVLKVAENLLLQKNGRLSEAREDAKKYLDAMSTLQDPVLIDGDIALLTIHTK